MSLKQITAPASEPLTLNQVKLDRKLVLSDTDEDDLLTTLIIAAREMAETTLNRQLVEAEYRLTLGCFPSRLVLPMSPLIELTDVKYLDVNDAEQTLDAAQYQVDTDADPAVIHFTGTMPTLSRKINRVSITFTAGYTDTDPINPIPSVIIKAMLLMIGHWYENREDSVRKMPTAAEWLLFSKRDITFA